MSIGRLTCVIVIFLGTLAGAVRAAQTFPEVPSGAQAAAMQKRIAGIIASMSLEEKVEQLHGMGLGNNEFGDLQAKMFGTRGDDRAKIPSLIMGHGITGVRVGRDSSIHSTYFGSPTGYGATWDVDLYARVGAAMGQELRALGQDLSLGPTINIIRNPRGGRSWESLSEDPFLTARFIAPYVKAEQAQGVICGPKHYAANNQENNRHDINNVIDERALREIYLPGFRAAVVEGGALNLMAAYNRVNGTFMSENHFLLTDVLRNDWKFQGFVLSDFALCMHSTKAPIMAGMNVEMDGVKYYGQPLLEAVRQGQIPQSRIDQLLAEKLHAMAVMGILDGTRPAVPRSEVHCAAHQAVALEVARRSPILLKNEGGILPLDRHKLKRIAVIGPNAEKFSNGGKNYALYLQGGGSGHSYYFPDAIISPLKGVRDLAGSSVEVSYALGCRPPTGRDDSVGGEDRTLTQAAAALAAKNDVVVLVLGLSGFWESEGFDKPYCHLSSRQEQLLHAVVGANPKTVVVLATGSYLEPGDWLSKVPALVTCFYSGEKMGQGLAEVLFGDRAPSGRLPVSWPMSEKEYPAGSIYTGGAYSKDPRSNNNIYSEGIWVGYRYFDKHNSPVAYPFGYGLSYTTFGYSDLQMQPQDQGVVVRFNVKNTGARAGREVPQVYVHELAPSIERPIRELKGFTCVDLAPGETKPVQIVLDRRAFAFYSPTLKKWKVDAGDFEIQVGSSSRDIHLHENAKIEAATLDN